MGKGRRDGMVKGEGVKGSVGRVVRKGAWNGRGSRMNRVRMIEYGWRSVEMMDRRMWMFGRRYGGRE